jgi:hypothetical protein
MVALLIVLVLIAVALMLCGVVALVFGKFPPLHIGSRWTGLAVLVAGFLLFYAGGIAIVSTITA